MIEIAIFALLLGLGYFFGTQSERSHLKSLRKKETQLSHVSWSSFGKKNKYSKDVEGQLFIGHVVIAQDYFKVVVASLIGILGGRITVFESLLDRGRREALCRLRSEAYEKGFTSLVNVRFETATIGMNNQSQPSGSIEVVAYGTGVRDKTNIGV